MRITLILALILVIGIALTGTSLTPKQDLIETPSISINPPAAPEASCQVSRTSFNPILGWATVVPGTGVWVLHDPEAACGPGAYPYAITSFDLSLFDQGTYNWPVDIAVVVYDMADPSDPCAGMGPELCRIPVSADESTFKSPAIGTVTFPVPCCVNNPFFIGIEYISGAAGSTPSPYFDDGIIPACEAYVRYADGPIMEWHNWWPAPAPGFPVFSVNGQTNAPTCGGTDCSWTEGDPAKMHFPQPPDDDGWTAYSANGFRCADDWQCSETGFVKDFHFWGGWHKDSVGAVTAFNVRIYTDRPPDASIPFSIPYGRIWEKRITNFTTTELATPTEIGWIQTTITPHLTDSTIHRYFQYDICLNNEEDWFLQEEGTRYWLEIEAETDHINYGSLSQYWSWLSSINHYGDAAVFYTGTGHFYEQLLSPVLDSLSRYNQFFVDVDLTGTVVEGGGTDFYGNGWILFPSGWWTIWFFDHILYTTRYKEIHVEFDATPLFTAATSHLEFAVNYTNELWRTTPDSVPPMPGDGYGETYIVREVLLVTDNPDGHYSFDITVPHHNPEWVSIDVQGENFHIINGTIEHHCVGYEFGEMNMDLSFVITGDAMSGTGACCMPDGSCYETDQLTCQNGGGEFQGSGTDCATSDCNDAPYAMCSGSNNGFADASCVADINVDDGSYDPNGDQITLVQKPASPYPAGLTDVWLVVTDEHGKSDSCLTTVFVFDTINPIVECPNDTTIEVLEGSGGAILNWEADFADNCSSATITGNPPSGTLLTPGDWTIAVIATDPFNNADTCYFTATIVEVSQYCGQYCDGYTGNVDCSDDGKRNLADITRLIDRVYISKLPLCIEAEGNIDGDELNKVNLADITRLIDHVYISKNETALCQ